MPGGTEEEAIKVLAAFSGIRDLIASTCKNTKCSTLPLSKVILQSDMSENIRGNHFQSTLNVEIQV